jgi:Tfp pilus assembly protein PilV
MPPFPRPRAHRRRGSLLIELTVATAMLIIGMSLAVKVLGYAALQRRSAEQRQRALQEVANVMERITADPFDEVTPERARAMSISPSATSSLPGAELAVEVTPSQPGAGRSARRIAVRLRWRNRAGEWEAPVRLTTWIERGRAAP